MAEPLGTRLAFVAVADNVASRLTRGDLVVLWYGDGGLCESACLSLVTNVNFLLMPIAARAARI